MIDVSILFLTRLIYLIKNKILNSPIFYSHSDLHIFNGFIHREPLRSIPFYVLKFTKSFYFLQVFVSPPLYRQRPTWYQQGLTQIAAMFSSAFSTNPPPNLRLLPSFSSQELEPDGKHLSPVSGLHYIIHLFDKTEALLASSSLSQDAQFSIVQEQVRHHEDRMSFLENRHVSLQQQVSSKTAADAEINDWVQNRNEEDWFVIQGVPRLTGLSDKEWPAAAKKQVTDYINLILHTNRSRLDFEVQLVSNPFKLRTSGPTTYNVRMDSYYSLKVIRDIFSGFFRRNKPLRLPPPLKGVSLRNKVTLETKIRISILRQLGERYKDSNSGASYRVKGYDPRPTITTMPPRSANARFRTYNFIQAVSALPSDFTDENLTLIYQVVGDRFRGKLQSLFVVLRDDDHDRCLELVANSSRRARGPGPSQPVPSADASAAHASGFVQGFGSGMELESNLLQSLQSPPLPPPSTDTAFPTETDNSRAHDARVRFRRREDVRLPTPDSDRRGLKRHHQSSSSDSSRRSESHRKSKKSKKSRSKRSHKKRRRHSSSSDSESGSAASGTSSGHGSKKPSKTRDASKEA